MEGATPSPCEGAQPKPGESSPGCTAPTSYKIGNLTLEEPLVTIPLLKIHLRLLDAFKKLRVTVEERDAQEHGLPAVVAELPKEKRWTWFVGLAVERFQRWVQIIRHHEEDDMWVEENMPPIDVLMVWHAYLLNPSWYREDSQRLNAMKKLESLANCGRLLSLLIKVGDINDYTPEPKRMGEWRKTTGTHFDPLDAMINMTHRDLDCPRCDSRVSVPLMVAEGTGYLQHLFSFPCGSCKYDITKESLAVSKFAHDLYGGHLGNTRNVTYRNYVAGSLYNQFKEDAKDVDTAERIQALLLRQRTFKKGRTIRESCQKLLDVTGGRIKGVQAAIVIRASARRNRIIGAYTDDRLFSVDLAGAVLRQGTFADKMHSFAWTAPAHFDDPTDEVVLAHAIARYHAFLDLMSSSPTSFFVPTLDIDLVWHTHQMMGQQYGADCLKYVQCFVDHNDRVEDQYLTSSFDITCRAWQQRFGVPYTHCGCPLPGETIGRRLSSVARRLSLSSSNPITTPSLSLHPPHHANALSATHPSEHNSVSKSPQEAECVRAQRSKEMNKRRQRDAKRVEEGKMSKEEYELGGSHNYGFLYPVPFFYPPVATCAAMPIGFVDGGNVGGCAVGMGGCGSGGCGGGGEGSGI